MIDIFFENVSMDKRSELKSIIKNTIQFVVKELKIKKNFYISVLVTNNLKIKEINYQYRKINKETNVLSFNQNEERILDNKNLFIVLGDIVISVEKIISESREQKKKFKEHLVHMIVHSFLHLSGYTHDSKKDSELMEKKEISILSKMSIPSPY